MKFSPQIHLFLCLAMLGNMLAPAIVRADPPRTNAVCTRINTPEAKADEKVRQSNRQKLFASWNNGLIKDYSRQHRSLKYINKTALARNSQQGFMKTLTDNVTIICEAQYTAEAGVTKLAAKMNEGSGQEMCGRFAEIENFYGQANTGITFLQTESTKSLNKIRDGYFDGANKNRSNLDEIDMSGGNTKEQAPLVTFPHSTGTELDPNAKIQTASSPHISLREEMGVIWGSNLTTSKGQQGADFQADPNSFYGGIIRRLQNETKQLSALNEKFATQKAKMGSMRNDCVAAGFELPKSTVADTASAESDINIPQEQPQKESDLGAKPATVATETVVPERINTDSVATVETDTTTQPDIVTDDGRLKPPPYVDTKVNPPLTEVPAPKKVEEEGWISRNSGLLLTVGGGAAAVGGLLWYKNSQDKKAKQEAEALDAEARAIASVSGSNSSSSSTSTSTNTDSTYGGTPANSATPQGSKMVLSGIPSGSVGVNTRLPEITVAIINPAGILTQDSHSEIIVSCVEPAGCSLTGTGQAQTSAGKARFNDLRFTSPHDSVKLLFSSPGFDSVMSVSFGVTGESGGVDTITNTSTSTTTSTSTNTGGNRE